MTNCSLLFAYVEPARHRAELALFREALGKVFSL